MTVSEAVAGNASDVRIVVEVTTRRGDEILISRREVSAEAWERDKGQSSADRAIDDAFAELHHHVLER